MEDLEALREALRRAGRYYAGLRRRVRGKCAVCGAEFVGTTRRMYCSLRCAQKAYRQRRAEELRARRRERYLRSKVAKSKEG